MAFVKVMETKDVPLGEGAFVEVGDEWIAVFHTVDGFYAIDDVCSHAQASLSEGDLEGHVVICPRHGGRFDVTTGEAVGLPAYAPVKSYPLRLEGEEILVEVDTGGG